MESKEYWQLHRRKFLICSPRKSGAIMGPQFREFATAWVRLVLALYVVICLPWLPLVATGKFDPSILPFILAVLLASPAVLFRDALIQRDPPYLKRGWWGVVIYGPVLFAATAIWASRNEPVDQTGAFLFFLVAIVVYEVGIFLTAAVYVFLWRIGDKYLAPAPDLRRRLTRAGVAAALLLAAIAYPIHARRQLAVDRCLDDGGRVAADGSCDFGRAAAKR